MCSAFRVVVVDVVEFLLLLLFSLPSITLYYSLQSFYLNSMFF